MRKSIAIAALAAALTFLLASCSGCETAECYKAKSDYESKQAEIQRQNEETERRFELEREKIRAEAEAKKPESVRLQEAKNKEPSATDGIGQAAGWAAGAYVIGKVLESAR